jgi:hypothetical protein
LLRWPLSSRVDPLHGFVLGCCYTYMSRSCSCSRPLQLAPRRVPCTPIPATSSHHRVPGNGHQRMRQCKHELTCYMHTARHFAQWYRGTAAAREHCFRDAAAPAVARRRARRGVGIATGGIVSTGNNQWHRHRHRRPEGQGPGLCPCDTAVAGAHQPACTLPTAREGSRKWGKLQGRHISL